MLKLMRDNLKNLKWILWFVVVIFVLMIFVEWGSGRAGRVRGDSMAGLAARIGSTNITETQFLKELRTTEERYRQMYGKQFETFRNQIDLATMTVQHLVDRQLLRSQADTMGIEVSDQDVLAKITAMPVFQRSDGGFVGEQLYNRILRSNQMSPEEFEGSLRSELMLQRLQETLSAGIVISDAELEKEYRNRNENASFAFFFLPVDRELAAVTVSDAEAKTYFDAHPSTFEHPEQRQLRYLLVDESRLRRTLSVADNQIAEYYKSHAAEFQASDEVSARHILIRPKTQDDAGWKEAQTRATAVWGKAAAPNADFVAIAKQYTEDTGSKETGGDLGWFGRGRMVKEFEDAVFSLRVGQVSGPVKSQFGYHIIKLENRRAPRLRPLEEVREQVRSRLLEGLADGEGSRRAAALRQKIDAAKLTTDEQWRTLADDVVSSNMTPFFAKGETIPGLGRDQELVTEVGGAIEGFIGGPRRTSRGWVIYRVSKVRPAGVSPFDEAKEQAKEAVKRVKAVDVVRQKLETERATLASTAVWTDKATALGGYTEAVKEHKRGTSIQRVGVSAALENAIFATSANGITPVVAIGERGAALARVTAVKTADLHAFAQEKAALRQTLVGEELQRLLASMLAEARRENKIVINQALMDRFKPRQG